MTDYDIELSDCSDLNIIKLAVDTAGKLAEECLTSVVMLTSTCPEDGHGTHVTMAIMSKTGTMSPSEARAAVRRLRSAADELEQRFCPEGNEN